MLMTSVITPPLATDPLPSFELPRPPSAHRGVASPSQPDQWVLGQLSEVAADTQDRGQYQIIVDSDSDQIQERS